MIFGLLWDAVMMASVSVDSWKSRKTKALSFPDLTCGFLGITELVPVQIYSIRIAPV